MIFIFLQGCSGKISGTTYVQEKVRVIQEVPFYKDTNHQCGPSSLASVMNYWYAKKPSFSFVTPDKISAEVYSKGARGTLGIDLEFYAKKNGFQTMQYSGSIDDLRNNILNEIPIIILVDYGAFFYQRNHFMVVTGYSGDGIITHSGSEEKFISFDELKKIWGKNRFWTLIVKPSD
jgi:predicted double-glycine peptidase